VTSGACELRRSFRKFPFTLGDANRSGACWIAGFWNRQLETADVAQTSVLNDNAYTYDQNRTSIDHFVQDLGSILLPLH